MYQVLTVDALGRKARAELYWMTARKPGMRRWDGCVEMCILTRQKMHEGEGRESISGGLWGACG